MRMLALLPVILAFTSPAAAGPPQPIALEHVEVVAMADDQILHDQTVIVEGDRIAAIGPAASLHVPPRSLRVDARGKYLIPGLSDMHAHLTYTEAGPVSAVRDELLVYLANGVTSIRNPAGSAWHLLIRNLIEQGELLGPRMFTAGPILEQRPSHAGLRPPRFRQVTTAADAADEVRAQRAYGYDFIKIYNQIDPPVYQAIIDTARTEGMPVFGHVPIGPGLDAALSNRHASIEHFRGFDLELSPDPRSARPEIRFAGWPRATDAQLRQFSRMTAAAEMWIVPTMLAMGSVDSTAGGRAYGEDYAYLPAHMYPMLSNNYLHNIFSPEVIQLFRDGLPRQRAFVRELVAAGASVMAGTDAAAPGIGLHQEIKALRASGISNYEALRTATSNPGRWFREYSRIRVRLGTIEVGTAADLVLLGGNPLADISNIDRIEGVMTRGRWFDRAALDAMLEELQARNQPLIEQMRRERADGTGPSGE